jgi:Pregnancy-associated plasma protein-A/Secretion system C-terminal sorting domain
MKVFFAMICWGLVFSARAQRCAEAAYEQLRSPLSSSISATASTINTSSGDTLNNEVIVIPVVIHVLYHASGENISDQQVLSQLAVLNNDYRRLNADTINTPVPFRNIAADTRIAFCLARVDPYGRSTSGIIHKYTKESLFLSDDGMKFSSSGGDDGWDSKKYLNIWVCNLFGRTLGYGVLPGGATERDGVVIQYYVFGTTGKVNPPYDKGRTTTHEVGHWLGLRHLWGDASCGDDGISDTPPQQSSNSGCPSFPHLSSCSANANGDMFMNFMDFTDDACMNMFTQGQKTEMRSLFAAGAPRNSFLNSFACDSSLAQGGPLPDTAEIVTAGLTVYPNPFNDQVTVNYKNLKDIAGKTIRVYDVMGKVVFEQAAQAQQTVISLHQLAAGVYFLHIQGALNAPVMKLVKHPAGSL